jgi:hypothetical protein
MGRPGYSTGANQVGKSIPPGRGQCVARPNRLSCLSRLFAALSTLLFLVCALQVGVVRAQQELSIEFDDRMVSVNSEQVDQRRLLQELSQRVGFKLWMAESIEPRPVSLHIDRLPVEETLRRILADSSYALVFDDNGSLSALYVLPPGAEQPSSLMVGPEGGNLQQQAARDALQSELLPDNIKAAN